MPRTALAEVTSYESLRAAWRSLYTRSRPYSRNTRGIDGVSINDFAIDPKPHLRRITAALRQGLYEFAPLRAHLIPKPNGKERLICVPTIQDRIVQRALLEFLTTKYLVRLANPISYGFIRYRTVKDAAIEACKHRKKLPWVFKTDITSFFDEIDRDVLQDALHHTVRDRSLLPLLADALSCEAQPSTKNAEKKIAAMGIRVGRGVRQGMPLSPLFANVVLQRFDDAIIKAGLTALRYADDLIFFADSEEACIFIQRFCKMHLKTLDLTVPEIGPGSKSQIYGPEDPAEFLGLGLVHEQHGYVLRVMPTQIERIRREISQLQSIKELLARKVTLANLGTHIQNRVTGYFSAYEVCTNVEDLEHVFDELTQKVLVAVYRDGLKINLGVLSGEAKAFLGLH
jgi:group II intron reverse transcriptase/maturase